MNGGHRGRRRAGGRSWLRRRWWLLSGGLLALLLVLGFWLGDEVLRTQSSLTATRDHLGRSATAIAAGDMATAQQEMTLASDAAAEARAATSSLPWVITRSVPVLGQPFGVTGQLAAVTDDLIVQVLQPTLSSSTALLSGKLRLSGGRIDLGAIADSQTSLTKTAAAAGVLDDRANAIAHPRYICRGRRRAAHTTSPGLAISGNPEDRIKECDPLTPDAGGRRSQDIPARLSNQRRGAWHGGPYWSIRDTERRPWRAENG